MLSPQTVLSNNPPIMAESQGTQIATEPTKELQPQVKKEYKALKWIRRHHRILTFAGAVIVFATFIVKDAIRERLRDLSESIKEAQTDYIATLNTSEAFFAY